MADQVTARQTLNQQRNTPVVPQTHGRTFTGSSVEQMDPWAEPKVPSSCKTTAKKLGKIALIALAVVAFVALNVVTFGAVFHVSLVVILIQVLLLILVAMSLFFLTIMI